MIINNLQAENWRLQSNLDNAKSDIIKATDAKARVVDILHKARDLLLRFPAEVKSASSPFSLNLDGHRHVQYNPGDIDAWKVRLRQLLEAGLA